MKIKAATRRKPDSERAKCLQPDSHQLVWIGAESHRKFERAGLETWPEIQTGKAKLGGGKREIEDIPFAGAERDLGESLQFEHRADDRRDNVPREEKDGRLALHRSFVDDIDAETEHI